MKTTAQHNQSDGLTTAPSIPHGTDKGDWQQQALQLAAAGLPVFPATLNKTPYVKDWEQVATTDPEQIATWWGVDYPNALPAVPVGRAGLVVVDLDQHHAGQDGATTLAAVAHTHPAPVTRWNTSLSGNGQHHYYRVPNGREGRNTANVDGLDGVDLRGHGGYVIWPGAPLTVEQRAALPAAEEWMLKPIGQQQGDGYNGTVQEWLNRTAHLPTDGAANGLATKYVGREFGNQQLTETLRALVAIGAEGRNPGPALDVLRREWLRPPKYNTPELARVFDELLARTVTKFGASVTPSTSVFAPGHNSTPTREHGNHATAASASPVPVDDVPRPLARMVTVPASAVTMRRQRWLWADRIPMDTPSIFAGRGGEGKTTFALDLAAKLTRGTLPGEHEGHPAAVLIWSGEDRAETVLVPRLQAANADLDRVHIITGIDHQGQNTTTPKFPEDTGALAAVIDQVEAALVILDPLTSTTGGDLHKVADVRRTLDGLAEVTHETGAVILGIMHFNKGQGHAGDKLSGSHAFRDAVRSLFLFATDNEHGCRVVTQEKNNYAENTAPSLAFNLESVTVEVDGGVTQVARVQHLGESEVSVQDLINRPVEDEEERADRSEAEQWLVSFLTREEFAGTAPSRTIMAAAKKDGFKDRTMQRAGAKLCVKSSTGFQQSYVWTLKDATDPVKVAMVAKDATPLNRAGNHGNHGGTTGTGNKDAKSATQHQGAGNLGNLGNLGPVSSSPKCEACDKPILFDRGDGRCSNCAGVTAIAPPNDTTPSTGEALA